MITNSQIDRLGAKLRSSVIDANSLRDLEDFRGQFAASYRYVEDILTEKMGLTITGRPSKSTVAIVEKLKRETIRLSQMQDIAGCRILVPALGHQNHCLENIRVFFGDVEVDDKRLSPTNGYRAVHVILRRNGRPVEIQVRTSLQHFWAEISEKVADAFGHEIKYGKGDDVAIEFLNDLSMITARLEELRNEKLILSRKKSVQGKSKETVRAAKLLSEEERECIRRINSLFSGKLLVN